MSVKAFNIAEETASITENQSHFSDNIHHIINRGAIQCRDSFKQFETSLKNSARHCYDHNRADIQKTEDTTQPLQQSRLLKIIQKLVDNFTIGHMEIIFADGSKIEKNNNDDGPHGILVVRNKRCFKRFLTGGSLGICEAYIDGDFDSPNLAALYTLCLLNQQTLEQVLMGKVWVRALSRLYHILRPNSRKGARKNISAHYDLGNDFYKKWLDETMTYSSALFEDKDQSLKAAQNIKYEALCRSVDLKPRDHVLEIGCGWGGFAEYAAREYGAKVTALTISKEQYDFAKARIEKAGLADLVEIRFQDYRDVSGQFDKIVSIEMFEAVGEQYWSTYFDTVKARLKQGGKAAFQIITIDDSQFDAYRKKADYIQKYIFPGGMLPSLEKLREHSQKAGLSWDQLYGFGQDYAKTLMIWNEAFQEKWSEVEAMGFDKKFKRIWEQYLAYCTAGFISKQIDVVHLTLKA